MRIVSALTFHKFVLFTKMFFKNLGAEHSIVIILIVSNFFCLITVRCQTLKSEETSSNGNNNNNNNNNDGKKITKLQIGIKKRVDDCQRHSSKGDILHIHYRGTLHSTGAEFDSSYKRGTPLKFTLGAGQVIAGWDQGLLGICQGEKRKLVIPSDLAYGTSGSPPTIPPNSALIFEVECIKIENRKSDL